MKMTDYLQGKGMSNRVNGCQEQMERPEEEEADKKRFV